MTDIAASMDRAWVRLKEERGEAVLSVGGEWDIANVGNLFDRLQGIRISPAKSLSIDLSRIETLDTAGAWLMYRTLKKLGDEGVSVNYVNVSPRHAALLEEVAANDAPCEIEPRQFGAVANIVEEIGATTVGVMGGVANAFGFIGALIQNLSACLVKPQRLRFTSLVYHMEQVGLRALPIIGLISFLIGVVIAYLGAQQLRQFGAEVFVVDLLAIAILRELGVLITAIVIAGRSGSAFTAELGSMKLNEEVDALRVIGLDPMELLVLPRVLALMITMPMLAFVSDMLGLLGGGVMCWLVLDIPPSLFLDLLNKTMTNWTFWVGMIKAPAFAFIIAVAGCYEGLRVGGSAESVGHHTTKSVVESIFLIIVANAIFSMFFATLEI